MTDFDPGPTELSFPEHHGRATGDAAASHALGNIDGETSRFLHAGWKLRDQLHDVTARTGTDDLDDGPVRFDLHSRQAIQLANRSAGHEPSLQRPGFKRLRPPGSRKRLAVVGWYQKEAAVPRKRPGLDHHFEATIEACRMTDHKRKTDTAPLGDVHDGQVALGEIIAARHHRAPTGDAGEGVVVLCRGHSQQAGMPGHLAPAGNLIRLRR